jgi:hypothetical protein
VASRSSALRLSTSSSRTARTSTGRARAFWNISISRLAACPRCHAAIGPDATGVGWVYQYAVLAKDKTLAELRTLQDWYLRYQLTKAHGVAEVASIGGFVQTYQVTVDPVKLRAYGIPLEGLAGYPRLQPRCWRSGRRDGRNRVYGARQGLSARCR